VFEDPEAPYDAAMQEFVRRSAQRRQQEDAAWEAAC
jgi:hypothetical protein